MILLAAQLNKGVVAILRSSCDFDVEVTKYPEVEAGLWWAQPVLTPRISKFDDLVLIYYISGAGQALRQFLSQEPPPPD